MAASACLYFYITYRSAFSRDVSMPQKVRIHPTKHPACATCPSITCAAWAGLHIPNLATHAPLSCAPPPHRRSRARGLRCCILPSAMARTTGRGTHLTTEMSIPWRSMNLNFSSRAQYCGPTGLPPLGSLSRITKRSSPSSRVKILGTVARDRSTSAYRGR